MSPVVVGVGAIAFLLSFGAMIRDRDFSTYSTSEMWMVGYVAALVGWPQVCTFLIGPLIFPQGGDAGAAVSLGLSYAPPLVISFAYFVRAMASRQAKLDLAALLQTSILVISFVFLVFAGLPLNKLVFLLMVGGLALAALAKPAPIRLAAVGLGCRVALVMITAADLLTSIVNSAVTVEPCRADKCGIAAEVLTSPFAGNGNVLGLSIAMIVPFAVANIGIYRSAAVVLAVISTTELAGSRTAEGGVFMATVLVTLIWLLPKLRRQILIGGFVAALALSLLPAVIPFGTNAFTYRGFLWIQARAFIGENPILGRGPLAWVTYGQSSIQTANYSPHNGWLDIVLSVGLSGMLIIVLAVALKVRQSSALERDALLLYFSTLLVIQTLESIYVPYTFGIVPFACILPFLYGTQRNLAEPDAAGKVADSRSLQPPDIPSKGDRWTS